MATEERTQKSATADLPQEYRGPGRWSGMMGTSIKWSVPIGLASIASAYGAIVATFGALLPKTIAQKAQDTAVAAATKAVDTALASHGTAEITKAMEDAAETLGHEAFNKTAKTLQYKGWRNAAIAGLAVLVPGAIYTFYKGYQKGSRGEQDYKNVLKRAEDLALENEKLKIDNKWANRVAEQRGQSAEHVNAVIR